MISIIIITYNQERFILKTLKSVFSQDFAGRIQVIIANDASTDGTAGIIEEFLKGIPGNFEVDFLNHRKNLGVNANFACTIALVRGDYLAICEGDDYWTDEKKLSVQYDFMTRHPDYAICFHGASQIDANDNIIASKQFDSIEDRDYTAAEIYQRWLVHTSTVFIRADVLKNAAVKNMFRNPKIIYSDTPLFMAASLNGKLRGLPVCMSAYRRHEGGVSHGHNIIRDLNQNLYDYSIGKFYSGKIKDISEWNIYKRSRDNFRESLKRGQYMVALKYAVWLVRMYKKIGITMLRKLQ